MRYPAGEVLMFRHTVLVAIALCACKSGDTYTPPDTDDTDISGETDTEETDTEETDVDTDLPETDDDGDGWSVEDGDCDDTSIWVNPAWAEVPDDDKDNDCDGVTDEEWTGVRVADIDVTEGAENTELDNIDPFGDDSPSIALGGFVAPSAAVVDGEDWIVASGNGVYRIGSTGSVSEIWRDEEEYEYGEGPLGYFGVGLLADGTILMSGGDRLWAIDEDAGTAEIAAQWDCLDGPYYATTICPTDLAVDRFTGEVGLPGFFGGFGIWTPETGLVVEKLDDIEYGTPSLSFVQKRDNGAWIAFGADPVTGAPAFYKWDETEGDWAVRVAWTFTDFNPVDFQIEQTSGDYYTSANGGWYNTVFRTVADGSYTAMLYPADLDFTPPPYHSYGAIDLTYDHD